MASNIKEAHKALGKPKMPDDIAGIDIEVQSRLSAVRKVSEMH